MAKLITSLAEGAGMAGCGGVSLRSSSALQSTAPAGAAPLIARHEAAAAHLARDQALGFEHFVGGGNGSPVQSKQASQFASGWQAFAAGQLAGADFRSNLLEYLAVERDFGVVYQGWPEVHPAIPYHIGLAAGQ